MWDDPRRLNAAALLLLLTALALLAWGGISWATRQPVFAIGHVAVDGALVRVNPAHIGAVIREELRGTFFTMRLADARAS